MESTRPTIAEARAHGICNGCGAKGGIRPPQWIFVDSCDEHDIFYELGGDKDDRKVADRWLLDAMNEAARSGPWYRRPYYHLAAWVYYLAIRRYGARYFNFR